METLAAKFVLDVPDWPIVLKLSAGLMLAFELLAMLRRIWSGRSVAPALAQTLLVLVPGFLAVIGGYVGGPSMAMLALLSGPLILAGAAAYSVLVSLGQSNGRGFAREAFHGPAICSLATLAFYYPGVGSILTIAFCAIVWVLRSYGKTTSPVKPAVRRLLMGLRILAILLLAAWLAHPGLEYEKRIELPSVVLLGVDSSASMQRKDMPPDYTKDALGEKDEPVRRIDAVRQAISKQADAIKALAENGDAGVFTFALKAKPQAMMKKGGDIPADALILPEPVEPATALGDCINDAFTPYAAGAEHVAAIVLFTDGCNNTSDVIDPEKECELMGSRRVPIYTVGVGSDKVMRSTRTLNVKELRAADKVEAFNRLPITAIVEAVGLEQKQIKVTAKFGDTEVEGSDTFIPGSKFETHTVQFVHVPLEAGYHRLTVTAEVVGSSVSGLEGTPSANKLVHVLDRELRVLYVEGRFRYETKYLTQALIAAKRFSLDRRVLLQPVGQQATPALSENPEDWLRYHVIILGDVEAASFTPKQLDILKDLISNKGKGLCMIGGGRSFGRGGWANTPLADVLPVELTSSGGQIDAMVQVLPTPEGLRSEIMRIGADETDVEAQWKKLGPLNGCNKLGKAKPGATVLAETAQKDPLIVAQNYGSGRSLAIAFDTTWQWVLSPKDTGESQRRFWRQVALYLAAPKGNVWIGTDKTTYEYRRLINGSESVEVSAGVEDASGQPAPQALKEVTLGGPIAQGTTQPAKTIPIILEPKDNILRGKLPPPTGPGVYVLKISAEVNGKPLTAEHRFEVLERNLENLEVLANYDLLRKMSKASNGRFEPLSNLEGLLKELKRVAKPKTEQQIVHEDFSNIREVSWVLAAVLMLLFCLEWSIRKRRGLV